MIRGPKGHTWPEAFLADVDTAIIRAAGSITHARWLRPIFAAVLDDSYARGQLTTSSPGNRCGSAGLPVSARNWGLPQRLASSLKPCNLLLLWSYTV